MRLSILISVFIFVGFSSQGKCDLSSGLFVVFNQSDLNQLFLDNDCITADTLLIISTSNTDPIVSLEPLQGLSEINFLRIIAGELKDLRGTETIKKIGTLQILNSDKLNDISALKGLLQLETLTFTFNDHITDLTQFNYLPHPKQLELSGNASLSGWAYEGNRLALSIGANSFENNLADILKNGLDTLSLSINIGNNFSLKGISKVNYLSDLGLLGIDSVSLEGLESHEVIGNVTLSGNGFNDTTYNNFSNLETVQGQLHLVGVDRLLNFSHMFPKLRVIGERLSLMSNDSLYDLSILNNIEIPKNNFPSLHFEPLFDNNPEYRVFLRDNVILDYCYNSFICDAVNTYPDSVLISGNGTESCIYNALLSYCESNTSGNKIISPSSNQGLSHHMYPNPSGNNIFTIELDKQWMELSPILKVYSVDGKILMKKALSTISTEINHSFEYGMYYIFITSDGGDISTEILLVR